MYFLNVTSYLLHKSKFIYVLILMFIWNHYSWYPKFWELPLSLLTAVILTFDSSRAYTAGFNFIKFWTYLKKKKAVLLNIYKIAFVLSLIIAVATTSLGNNSSQIIPVNTAALRHTNVIKIFFYLFKLYKLVCDKKFCI